MRVLHDEVRHCSPPDLIVHTDLSVFSLLPPSFYDAEHAWYDFLVCTPSRLACTTYPANLHSCRILALLPAFDACHAADHTPIAVLACPSRWGSSRYVAICCPVGAVYTGTPLLVLRS